ncbi:MAG: hypothetical protein Q7R65_03975 [bacterium]|nr:hypothetical protein [bacterium]
MALLEWRIKRKLSVFFIVAGVAALFVFLYVYKSLPSPNCSDNKQNQSEEGVDCGGSCVPCVIAPKDVITLWTRVFELKGGVFEVASLIQNPNLFYGLSKVKYSFKLYDSQNVLVAAKEGETFIGPQDKFVIFATDIKIGTRKPQKADVEIAYVSKWQYIEQKILPLIVSQKKFSNTPFASLEAKLANSSLGAVQNIEAAAVLYDKDGNVFGASLSKIDSIEGQSSRNVVFTWPRSFVTEPVSSEIFTRAKVF